MSRLLTDDSYAICACGHYEMQHDPDCLVCLWQTSAGPSRCMSFRAHPPVGKGMVSPEPEEAQKPSKKAAAGQTSKYHAVRTNGYASKKEARYADELWLRQKAGEIHFWLEQVPFRLPGDQVYRLDFVVFYTLPVIDHPGEMVNAWMVRFIEVKGKDLSMGRLKRKQTEELYRIKIEVV